jgi:hypothetical protein
MTFGRVNQDVLSGATPLRRSPITGLSNATTIISRQYKKEDLSFDRDPNKTGFQNFGKFIKQFTKNPKKDDMSKAVALLKSGTASGI